MGADIYESYVTSMVATVIVASNTHSSNMTYMLLPVMISAFGLIGSVIGMFSNLLLRYSPAAMLRNATYVAIAFLACLFICLYALYGY